MSGYLCWGAIVCSQCLYLVRRKIPSPQVLATGHSENILLHNVYTHLHTAWGPKTHSIVNAHLIKCVCMCLATCLRALVMHMQRVPPLYTPWWMRHHTSRSPCTFNKVNRKDQRPNYLSLLYFNACVSARELLLYSWACFSAGGCVILLWFTW